MRYQRGAAILAVLLAALTLTFPAGAETPLERGTYLMQSIVACGNCHTPKGPQGDLPGMELAGMAPIYVVPGLVANAPNITPDKETGIGSWSDAEIVTAIREGRRPDGSLIGPPMPIPQYRNLSDRDVEAIVAYLRQVPPQHNVVPKSQYDFPLPESYGPPVTSVAEVPRGRDAIYGAYLAGPAGHCIECHSPLGPNGPDVENQLGAGGFEFPGPWGISVSANITPTGLADISDADIKQMITQGIRPDGSAMMPPMPYAYYKNLSADDVTALVAYLRSLPPK